MIRYAITAGNHGPFRKRERMPPAPSSSCPLQWDVSALPVGTPFLPFPPFVSLADHVRQLVHQGVDWIQLREKHLPAADLAALARQVLLILAEFDQTPNAAPNTAHRTRLLINSRADVAVATAAHGVHLSSAPGSLSPAHVRRLYRSAGLPRPTVSLACHTLPELRSAKAQTPDQSPDLILFSPVFGKCVDGHPIAPAGLDALQAACTLAHPIPVLALGGVDAANTAACLQAGAAGVAGIRLFQPSPRRSIEA